MESRASDSALLDRIQPGICCSTGIKSKYLVEKRVLGSNEILYKRLWQFQVAVLQIARNLWQQFFELRPRGFHEEFVRLRQSNSVQSVLFKQMLLLLYKKKTCR